MVGDNAADAALCRDASRHMAFPSTSLPPALAAPFRVSTRSSHFTASRQTPPTPWDLPTPAVRRETSAFATPGSRVSAVDMDSGHGHRRVWTLDARRTGHEGPQQPSNSPHKYIAPQPTTTARPGVIKIRGSARESETQAKLAGSPPNQPPTLQQNLLGRRSFGAEACPGDRCSCRWVARTAGWGPVEDHFLDTVADDPSLTETSAAGARLRC